MPQLKGWLGEKEISNILKKLPTEHYRLIDNVLLKRKDGSTVQIDHIVVSNYGIFVIETKNYEGIITGGDYSQQWTKHMYKKKYQFYNPTRQNYGHIKALEEVLELPQNIFISVIVFLSGAKLRVKSKYHVVNARNLKKTILTYKSEKLDNMKVNAIEKQIRSLNIFSSKAMKKHIRDIKQNRKRN